jgi:hypothetical protein
MATDGVGFRAALCRRLPGENMPEMWGRSLQVLGEFCRRNRRTIVLLLWLCVLANLIGIFFAYLDGYPSLIPFGLGIAAFHVTVLAAVGLRLGDSV